MRHVSPLGLGVLIVGLAGLSVAWIDKKLRFFPPPIPSENQLSDAGIALGKRLFFDTALSSDSSLSCGSCHVPESAFSGAGHSFNIGINGDAMRRNTPALFNLAWYTSMNWDGSLPSIEAQATSPITSPLEMGNTWPELIGQLEKDDVYVQSFKEAFGDAPIDSVHIGLALGQYLRSLISADSRYDQALRGEYYLSEDEYAGFELVNDQVRTGCLHCHVTDVHALGTTGEMAVNGLTDPDQDSDLGHFEFSKDSNDIGRFKIPSLRNLAYTAPYMHDGRFETLEEVMHFYNTGVHDLENLDSKFSFARQGLGLSEKEIEQIIAFLHTLNDPAFVAAYSMENPRE
jgi:cytochrome c peroxidase